MKIITKIFILGVILSSYILLVYELTPKPIPKPLTVVIEGNPRTLDPINTNDSYSIEVINQIYEGLYQYDLTPGAQMKTIPSLASEMGTWNVNKTELTIKLLKNVTFQDDSSFNSSSVKWNFDRLFRYVTNTSNTQLQIYLNDDRDPIINRTEIIDEFTIKFCLNKPWIVWEQLLANPNSFIIKTNENYSESFITLKNITSAVGTGPFIITDLMPDEKITFKRFITYRDGLANVEHLVFLILPYITYIYSGDYYDYSYNSAAETLLNHDAHYGYLYSDYINQAEEDPHISIERFKSDIVYFLQMNVNKISYSTRRAMAFAFDYSNYLEEVLANQSFSLHTPLPDGIMYHNPNIEGLPFYNLTLAREFLLDSSDTAVVAGLAANNLTIADIDNDSKWVAVAKSNTSIFNFNFTHYTSTGLTKLASVLIDSMSKIGINITDYVVGDWSIWNEWLVIPANKASLELTFNGWGPDYSDPINMVEPIFRTNASYNYYNFSNAALDQMMIEYYELTGPAREQMAWNIQQMIAVDICPVFYLYQRGENIFYNNEHLSNMSSFLNPFRIHKWYNVHYTVEYGGSLLAGDYSFTAFMLGIFFVPLIIASLYAFFRSSEDDKIDKKINKFDTSPSNNVNLGT